LIAFWATNKRERQDDCGYSYFVTTTNFFSDGYVASPRPVS